MNRLDFVEIGSDGGTVNVLDIFVSLFILCQVIGLKHDAKWVAFTDNETQSNCWLQLFFAWDWFIAKFFKVYVIE